MFQPIAFSCFVSELEVITVYARNIPTLYPMKMKLSAGANLKTCDLNRNSDCDLRLCVALLKNRLYVWIEWHTSQKKHKFHRIIFNSFKIWNIQAYQDRSCYVFVDHWVGVQYTIYNCHLTGMVKPFTGQNHWTHRYRNGHLFKSLLSTTMPWGLKDFKMKWS